MLMLKALIKSGAFYRLDHRNPDDGGAGSPVRAKPSPDAGSGSAALPEPDEPASGA
jgi:hypothetical protein